MAIPKTEKKNLMELVYAGIYDQGIQKAETLLKLYGNDSEIFGVLSGIYIELGNADLAEQYAKQAIKLDPLYVFAYFLLAKADYLRGNLDCAVIKIKRFLQNYDGQISEEVLAISYNLLAHIEKIFGNIINSLDHWLIASRCGVNESQKLENYSNYLFTLNYLPEKHNEEIFANHKKYNEWFHHIEPYKHSVIHHHPKIRIGYISPDFRYHVVVFFIYQLLARYDKNIFEVYCYAKCSEDDTSQQLKSFVDQWRNVQGMTDQGVAKIIYQDEIDILVDFSGHTQNNCLPILAYKPAPIQISGIGYFNTTGLTAIDYFLTDVNVDPIGQNDALFTEKLLRLPHTHFCYTAPSTMPEFGEAPVLKNGYITFGSFNNFTKVTDEMLAIWYTIMRQVPNSKLILKNSIFDNEDGKKIAIQRLKHAGFSENQLDLRANTRTYLHEYHDVDIALDTYPYPGGGTTCEALYMGVPVITLCGSRHGARFGYSLLKNIGLEELVAYTKEEYIEKAVGLANDIELVVGLHENLRNIMVKSNLMNGDLYISDIESAYCQIWEVYTDDFCQNVIDKALILWKKGDIEAALEKVLNLYATYANKANVVYTLASLLHKVNEGHAAINVLKQFNGVNEDVTNLLKKLMQCRQQDQESEKKFAFIACVNNDAMYQEVLTMLKELEIPEGYTVEYIAVHEATSMASGYNRGMSSTDAKYKIYLHQDLFILNKGFLKDILEVFKKDDHIGILGVAGAKSLPPNMVWWNSKEVFGKIIHMDTDALGDIYESQWQEVYADYEEVIAVDGCILATQYDIKWREDIFTGWDFYDISQCFEAAKIGYKVVVPKQREAWCAHASSGHTLPAVYAMYAEMFKKEYLSR